MKAPKFSLIVSIFILLTSCGNDPKNNISKKYDVIKEENYETSNKAQIIDYVVYYDTIYTENALKDVLLDVYKDNKDKDLFENFDAPTVFGVYLYTSKEILESDNGAWIGMLTKGPLDSLPRLSFNHFKLNSLQGLNDNKKSEDEIALDQLNESLQERGLELCSFYKQLRDIELECIHKADAKYPNYDYPKHGDYSNKLMKDEREKLTIKYDLADSIFTRVSVFGMSYCK